MSGLCGDSMVKNSPAMQETQVQSLCQEKEGNGNPFQYYCLGNLMERGAWWATAHGVTTRVGHHFATKQQMSGLQLQTCAHTEGSCSTTVNDTTPGETLLSLHAIQLWPELKTQPNNPPSITQNTGHFLHKLFLHQYILPEASPPAFLSIFIYYFLKSQTSPLRCNFRITFLYRKS